METWYNFNGDIMKVFKVKPRGYCKGVVGAIQIAKQAVFDYPNEDIYILGNDEELVENIIDVASRNGEKYWQLPLWKEYFDSLKN